MTFKEESLFFPLFFLFFFPFKFYFQAPLTAPSLLLLEMFHLLRGRQGEGSQNSLKTEKDFAKTGRLLGGKTILDSSVYSCSAPCFAFFLLFSTSSSSPLLAPCPSVLSHILLFISPPQGVPCPAGCGHCEWLGTDGDCPVHSMETSLGASLQHHMRPVSGAPTAGTRSIHPSSKGSPALQLLSKKGEVLRGRPPSPQTQAMGRTLPECPVGSHGYEGLKELCELVVPPCPAST